MQLTVRTYEDDVREQTLNAIERIANGTAKAAGVPEDRMPTVTRRDASTRRRSTTRRNWSRA